jgi:hypothetical protein
VIDEFDDRVFSITILAARQSVASDSPRIATPAWERAKTFLRSHASGIRDDRSVRCPNHLIEGARRLGDPGPRPKVATQDNCDQQSDSPLRRRSEVRSGASDRLHRSRAAALQGSLAERPRRTEDVNGPFPNSDMRGELREYRPATIVCVYLEYRAALIHDSGVRIKSLPNFFSFVGPQHSEVDHENHNTSAE